jgi:hypothetical protein
VKNCFSQVVLNGMAPLRSNFEDYCTSCLVRPESKLLKCPFDGKAARQYLATTESCSVFACSKKNTLVNGEKTFSSMVCAKMEELKTIGTYKKILDDRYALDYKRLLHNIESHDAHIIQEFCDIAPEDEMIRNHGRHREYLADIVRANPDGVSRALLKTHQSAIGIKNEITIYQRLYGRSGFKEVLEKHGVHRLFMNTAYKFFEDFSSRGIFLNISNSYADVLADFECASVVLYHLLDNARKYGIKDKPINIDFNVTDKLVCILLRMTSVECLPSEREDVFKPEFSGANAKKIKASSRGMGMAVVKDILDRSSLKLECRWSVTGKRITVGDIDYAANEFILSLRRYE